MEYKIDKKETREDDLQKLASKNAIERLMYMLHRKQLVWSAISMIIGVVSGFLAAVTTQEYVHDFFIELISFIIPETAAEDGNASSSGSQKSAMIGGIMVLIAILFIWALGAASFSKNTKTISLAHETVKTLTGFFIGILTGVAGK